MQKTSMHCKDVWAVRRECMSVSATPYVVLQQVKHALLRDLFRLVEFLQRLFELVVRHFPLTLLLIIKVQTAAFHLLQMVLREEHTCLSALRSLTVTQSNSPESLSDLCRAGSASGRWSSVWRLYLKRLSPRRARAWIHRRPAKPDLRHTEEQQTDNNPLKNIIIQITQYFQISTWFKLIHLQLWHHFLKVNVAQ